MKTLFTSMLLMTMVALQAMPVYNDSTHPTKKEKAANISTPSNPSTVSLQQLQDENAQLRAKVAALENAFENEKGHLNYKITMLGLLNKITEDQKGKKLDDLKAEINFQQVIGKTLLLLTSEAK